MCMSRFIYLFSKKIALITGITGQDGVFLSKDLVENDNYEIICLSRKNNLNSFIFLPFLIVV